MKSLLLTILALFVVFGMGASYSYAQTVTLRWLETANPAKESCGIQEKELNKAVKTLQKSLHKSGVSVELGRVNFTGAKPAGENASALGLWINNKPFESWVKASVSDPSEANPCQETTVEGVTYKLIPSELIVKAGMSAAENLGRPSAKTPETSATRS
jgi:hypothetical protein